MEKNLKPHPYADFMMQYALDAQKTSTPWLLWEFKNPGYEWEVCEGPILWSETQQYRRKSNTADTIKIGKHEFPRPMQFAPKFGTPYWYIIFSNKEDSKALITCKGKWGFFMKRDGDMNCELEYLAAGRCHLTKEAAQQHADVLNAINRGDV